MGEAMKRKHAKLKSLRSLRTMISVVVIIGAALSVVLNVQHAPKAGGWVAQVVGGFPPISVFLCIELMTRVPVLRRLPAIVRITATGAVAVMAGWVSYEQQYEFIHRLGFTGRTATLFPLIIDGTMLVATVSLMEVSTQVRMLQEEIAELEAAAESPAVPVAGLPVSMSVAQVVPAQRKPGPNAVTAERRKEREARTTPAQPRRRRPSAQQQGKPAAATPDAQQPSRGPRETTAPAAPVVVGGEPVPVPA